MAKKKQDAENIVEISGLSEKQVWDVLEFARNMNGLYSGLFNPDLVNARLKDMNMNPVVGTKTEVENATKNPKNNEESLRSYSEYFESTNMLYQRMLSYYGNMLAFDYTYTCTNIDNPTEYNSKRYKDDLKIVHSFLDMFNVKKEFKKVMHSLIRKDAFFSVLRTEGDRYVLQELPMSYTRITGSWEYGYLFDFNMMYFMANAGVDINMYPTVFKRYYNRIQDNKNNGYNPSRDIDHRTGEWNYWVQTSPEDGLWCWKLNMNQVGRIPMFTPLFLDFLDASAIRTLQYDKYFIMAYQLLVGIIPQLESNKSGNVTDMLAISPEMAGKFTNLIKQALPTTRLGIGVAPFDFKAFDFPVTEMNLLSDHNKNMIASSGTNRQLIFSTDKANIEETKQSIAVDEFMMEHIYPYFNNFLDYHINQLTKKYKFSFVFEGTEFSSNRQDRREIVQEYAALGIVLPQKFAASMGMQPHVWQRQIEEAKANGFVDALTPILNANQISAGNMPTGASGKAGRPQKKSSDLTESGSTTREQGSNTARGGDV